MVLIKEIYIKKYTIPSGKGSYLKAMVLLTMRRNLSLLSVGDKINFESIAYPESVSSPLKSSYSNIGLLH